MHIPRRPTPPRIAATATGVDCPIMVDAWSPPSEGRPPVNLGAAIVARSVHCRSCGYDLQSLPADGICPECGLAVEETLRALVDPESSRLPRLRRPRVVGTALVQLTVLVAVAALLRLAAPAWVWVGWDEVVVLGTSLVLPGALPALGVAAAALAIWPAIRLMPRGGPGSAAVRLDVVLIIVGLVVWVVTLLVTPKGAGAVTGWSAPDVVSDLVLAIAAVAVFGGLGGVLATVGRRSRAYRSSRSGRQGARAMIAAVVGITASMLVARATAVRGWSADVETLATVAMGVCGLMLAIGLLYLVVNTWWIRIALHQPPPSFDELLAPRLPPDASVPVEPEEPG